MINFWSKLNIGITLFSRKWWKLVDIFGQYIIQVSFFEFMSNICCFDLFPFNLFTPKTKYVMLWLKRIKDQIVEKKYFEQEFHQVLTIFFQIKCFRCLHFFFEREIVYMTLMKIQLNVMNVIKKSNWKDFAYFLNSCQIF